MAEESKFEDNWSQQNEYENDFDGKSDYSPVKRTNQDIIDEFKKYNRYKSPEVCRFDMKDQITENKADLDS
jgi:hypothetical protein